MVMKGIVYVLLLSGISIGAFMALSIIPGEKVFKEGKHDRIEDAWRIPDAVYKRHLYGAIENEKDVDYIVFPVDSSLPIKISIKNPAMDQGFEPQVIFFGPGLPALNQEVPIIIGDPNGALVGQTVVAKQRSIFEASELTTFLTGPELTYDVREPGTYAVAVTSPSGKTGRYVLTVGSLSEQGILSRLKQIPQTARALLRLY